MRSLFFIILVIFLVLNSVTSNAQSFDTSSTLISRIGSTPPEILNRFRDAGMSPSEHKLTPIEHEVIKSAIEQLPLLHKHVLKKHLFRISFLDNMPNTAFTAPLSSSDSIKLYTITVRAEILHQNVSEWLTEKERDCFDTSDTDLNVTIEAGNLSAFLYVLVHEATHVLDGALNLTPQYTVPQEEVEHQMKTNPFTKGAWKNRLEPLFDFQSDLLDKVYYKTRKKVLIAEVEKIYKTLENSPFVSLYGRNSYHEDLAELITIYHLTEKLGQEYRIIITKGDNELYSFEPMQFKYVQKRIKQLQYFY